MNVNTMKSRKLVWMMALISILALLAVGCSESEGSASPTPRSTSATQTPGEEETYFNKDGYPIIDGEPLTITVTGDRGSTIEWNDTILFEEVEKRLGIRLDANPISSEAWETQLTLMLATNDLPDLVINANLELARANQYGAEGFLLPLNHYIEDYAPNLNYFLNEYPMLRERMTSIDGNIYATTTYSLGDSWVGSVHRSFINANWLDNVGKDYPKTLDDLYDVLVAFRDEDANGNGDPNDEIPMSTIFDGTNFLDSGILTAFNIYSNRTNRYFLQLVDDQVTLMDTTENYKAYLKFMRQLMSEGLLDPESFIQTDDEFDTKIAADRVGVFGHWAPFVGARQSIDYDANFYWLGGLTTQEFNPIPSTSVWSRGAGTMAGSFVNANTEHPEVLVRLLDYFYSDEGAVAAHYGYEGITYDLVGMQGVPGAQVLQMRSPDGYESGEQFRYLKATVSNGFNRLYRNDIAPNNEQVLASLSNEQFNEIFDQIVEVHGWVALVERDAIRREDMQLVDILGGLRYTEEEELIATPIRGDVRLYLTSAKAQFITGEVDIDAGWDNYINTLNQMGLQELLEIEQSAYERSQEPL